MEITVKVKDFDNKDLEYKISDSSVGVDAPLDDIIYLLKRLLIVMTYSPESIEKIFNPFYEEEEEE